MDKRLYVAHEGMQLPDRPGVYAASGPEFADFSILVGQTIGRLADVWVFDDPAIELRCITYQAEQEGRGYVDKHDGLYGHLSAIDIAAARSLGILLRAMQLDDTPSRADGLAGLPLSKAAQELQMAGEAWSLRKIKVRLGDDPDEQLRLRCSIASLMPTKGPNRLLSRTALDLLAGDRRYSLTVFTADDQPEFVSGFDNKFLSVDFFAFLQGHFPSRFMSVYKTLDRSYANDPDDILRIATLICAGYAEGESPPAASIMGEELASLYLQHQVITELAAGQLPALGFSQLRDRADHFSAMLRVVIDSASD